MTTVFIGIKVNKWALGFEYAPIVHKDGGPYMTRWIIYLLWINIRLHQFFRGDYDRASHTHPWWFITIPFTSYKEEVWEKGVKQYVRVVRAWRFHWRPSNFEHIVKHAVIHGYDLMSDCDYWMRSTKPFWTLVIAGRPTNVWGFWTPDGEFRPYGDE